MHICICFALVDPVVCPTSACALQQMRTRRGLTTVLRQARMRIKAVRIPSAPLTADLLVGQQTVESELIIRRDEGAQAVHLRNASKRASSPVLRRALSAISSFFDGATVPPAMICFRRSNSVLEHREGTSTNRAKGQRQFVIQTPTGWQEKHR